MVHRLTDEHKMIQRTVRDFVDKELIPLENDVLKNEREGRPGISKEKLRELQLKAKNAGFWAVNVPEEYGGADLDPVSIGLINMELKRTFVPFDFGGQASPILYMANDDVKKRYLLPTVAGDMVGCFALTEQNSGSDPAAMRTTAVKDGNEWVLNGEKTWITNGNDADYVIVFAANDRNKGRDGGLTCFVVERSMGWKSVPLPTMGTGIEPPATLIFDQVRVPDANRIGEVGEGFKYAMNFINHNRGYIIPAWCIGAAERLVNMAIEYAKTRVTFGAPIADRQGIQWMIADSATEIEAAKGMLFKAAWMATEEGSYKSGKDSYEFRQLSGMAKFYSTNMLHRVVDRVLQIHGGMGISKEAPIERWYRETRVWRIFEGSDEIQRRAIANNLLKGKVKLGELIQ